MSYYMGDYYAGDPGFFGSLGRIFKSVAGSAVKGIPGVGSIVSGVGSIIRKGALPSLSIPYGPPETRKMLQAAGVALPPVPMPGGGMMSLGAPGALRTIEGGAAVSPQHCFRTSPRGRRIRVNCRTGKAIRHMRVTNPKALRRAIRRANGFAKLARKVLHFTSPKAPKGRAIFKKRRKK